MSDDSAPARRRFNWLLVVPLLVTVGLVTIAGLALMQTGEEREELPSMLAGRAAPALDVKPLGDLPTPTADALSQPGMKLVNFWASWCGPCRVEHPMLETLAAKGVTIIGVNYKDKPANALGFLDELGNPFASIGADANGRTGINWGIYGVPETFVVDGDGKVVMRFPGPITRSVYDDRFADLLGVRLD